MHTLLIGAFCVLAVTLLLSGLDDLIPLVILLGHRTRLWLRPEKPSAGLAPVPSESSIAIFVPCWKESGVIGNMVRHNLTAIRYRNFHIFLGAYPNDEATVAVAEQLADSFANIHVAVCPNPGPTSKADCLNSIYRAMQQFEQEQDLRFNTIVLHDAEDMIHPEALPLINRERVNYDMVQVPVLPGDGSGAILAKWGNTNIQDRLACTTNGATWTNGFAGVWHMGQGFRARNSGAVGARARPCIRRG